MARLAYRSRAEAETIGITGPPGAGKSTLTDRLIGAARAGGAEQVGVLAVDPSSPFSGGAILGDRVRMQDHATDPGVFIRSMATRGHLGGLTVAVPEAVRLLSAVGIPVILVETVGVGQVEVEVAGETDTTVVVVNPGWGDSVQANKAGLLEMADVFVVNKADRPGVKEARRDLEQMLDLSAESTWRPPIVETVAARGEGIDDLWAAIRAHRGHLVEEGLLDHRRRERLVRQFQQIVAGRVEDLLARFEEAGRFAELRARMIDGAIDPYDAADALLSALDGLDVGKGLTPS